MLSMMRVLAVVMLALVLWVAAGCGGGEPEPEPEPEPRARPSSNIPAGGAVEIARVLEKERKGIPADRGQWMAEIGIDPGGDLAYTVAEVVSPPGNANFRLANPQARGHDLTIEDVDTAGHVNTPVVRKGSGWVRISLFTGKRYVFYCSIPGHREAGMEGIIRVDPSLEEGDLKPF